MITMTFVLGDYSAKDIFGRDNKLLGKSNVNFFRLL